MDNTRIKKLMTEADDFSSVFITKRKESYRDIHVPSDLAEIRFSVYR